MVKWIIKNVDISDRTFKNSRQEVMGSFSAYNLHRMYHLPEPKKVYDRAFIEQFSKGNEDPIDTMQAWRSDSSKFKQEKTGMYPIAPLSAPHSYAAVMMCRLFGKANSTKFSMEWIPLIDAAISSTVMN